jgi:DNA-binding CsgD family transcriptional regulator
MWSVDRPVRWVGREQELAALRAGVEALRRGQGTVIWVEGEPGIGKSSLVAEGLAAGTDPSWDIGWGIAGTLTQRLPLRTMLDCLQVRPDSPDPRRARAAALLHSFRRGLYTDGDTSAGGIEVLEALVDELCAAAPTVMVIDDLQWADESSLIVWHQLAASISQLQLLLIVTCRPTPVRAEVRELRTAITRHGGTVVMLGPLPETDVTALVTAMLGYPPGDALRALLAQTAGNPLYLRELIDALVRERAIEIGSVAEVSASGGPLPESLAAVLNDRLTSVSNEAAQLLRTATLLGGTFAVTDLAVVSRRQASDLTATIEEAVVAGILIGSGPYLAFRHLLLQQALYESMPVALRTALHAEAAQEMAATHADVLSVAQQLAAAQLPGADWVRNWLLQSAQALAARAPRLAAELLRKELDNTPARHDARTGLTTFLVWALLAAGSYAEAAAQASEALTTMTDPARRAETHWVLTRAQVSAGRNDDAIAGLRRALASADLPGQWRARMLALLAMLERSATGDLGVADATALEALAAAEKAGDEFATAHALTDLWLISSIRRDHLAALGHIDQALSTLGDDADHADLRSFALDDRIFTLQNLDRWPQAELTLRRARETARRGANPDRGTWVVAAVLRYWLGQWDDALAELGPDDAEAPGLIYTFLRERWSSLLWHGVSALIAGRRDERTTASEVLRRGLALPIQVISDRENQDFLVAADALALEQKGDTHGAMLRLAAMLPRRDGEMTLIHQWLPDLVRLALVMGDQPTAQAAARACQDEAAAETRPARAGAASLRCQGLLDADPGPLQAAVAHYRAVGPSVELPVALEDLAVVQAARGQEEEARAALGEALSLYDQLEARWDIRRAEARLRPYGIRRRARGPRRQRVVSSGWDALTPTELTVATLVARGDSTAEIAGGMFLSRRTVQTYISRILAKLGAKGRADIVREALRQGVST